MYNAIINPIASVLGWILDILFQGLSAIGMGNTFVAIILFTLIVKLLMLPLTAKQQKMSKLQSIMSPEIQAINAKYKDKRGDQTAMLKMQEETKAVYAKYGVSQMGGCVQLIIQMPILMALYRVFQYIPMYVGQLKDLFLNILTNHNGGILSVDGFADKMSQINSTFDWTTVAAGNNETINTAITTMNSFTTEQWNQLKELFPAFADTITQNHGAITDINTFFGINMSQAPGFGLTVAVLIPIFAGITQYISVKVMQGKQQMDPDNPAAASMKMMTLVMPLMSVFIGFSVPAGLGVYWSATAVFQTIIQILINRYFDKIGVDTIVAKNVEKRNKKRAKKGLPPEKIVKNAKTNTKSINSIEKSQQRVENLTKKKEENDKKVKEILESTNYYKSAKPGSLAEKAGMVSKFNNKNKK